MNETYVTFQGWVGGDVVQREHNGATVATFRVAVTPRLRKKSGTWYDGETTWYSVTAWRTLADHVIESVKKGDAVIVHGRLRPATWVREGQPGNLSLNVEASMVGHDLTRGTSLFAKARRPEQVETEVEDELAALAQVDPSDEPQLDSWGEPRDQSPTEASAEAPAA